MDTLDGRTGRGAEQEVDPDVGMANSAPKNDGTTQLPQEAGAKPPGRFPAEPHPRQMDSRLALGVTKTRGGSSMRMPGSPWNFGGGLQVN